ncbi:hypothetical protein P5V15_007378 [Pogonomyrmex californicus]
MTFVKVLVTLGLIFIAVTALPVDGDDSSTMINYRLPDNIVPVHYDVEIIPYIEEGNFTFDGKSRIIIEIHRATRDLSLHVLELTIDETTTSLISKDIVIHTPTAHNYNNDTQILSLHFEDELPPGIYSLNIQFVGILNDNLRGFFRTSYTNEAGDKVWLAATHFEATSARRAFPCWDEPALKATFNISIKHHRNYTALSNMPIREQSDEEDDMVWTHFDRTPVMSTYLVAFVVSDYISIPSANGTFNMWCRPALAPYLKLAQEVAKKAKEILTEYTNTTDKVPKMDLVAVPQFTAGAMENWGLIIYVENNFKYSKIEDGMTQKLRVAVTAAHEIAHQWFGNIVSPLWWSHVWLNEGLASFFEEYILDQIFKEWRVMEFFVIKVQQTALHMDIGKKVKPVIYEVNTPEEIATLFSYSSYGKAPAILRMLQYIITPEVFRNGIIKYLHTHQFSSADSDDLWNALQAVLDESDVPHDDYRLKDVMNTWLKQRHYPVIHVTRNNDTDEIILRQEHYPQNKSEHIDSDKWWIPLSFVTQTNPDFSNTLPTRWLRPQDENISIDGIDPNDWIIINVQQMGYYRVNYDNSNWRKLANYLNSENYAKIHVLNRAQIINDAFHFMMAKQLDVQIFLDLAVYLSQETDFIALYPMFELLEYTGDFYKFPENDNFKQYVLHILDGLIKNVGYEENPAEDDFTQLKRANTLKWACNFGHSECKKKATIKLSEFLTNPEAHKISTELRDWMFCNGMMEANVSTWNKFRNIYIIKQNKSIDISLILEYLTCSENLDILINLLNETLNDVINKNYYQMILSNIIQKHSNNDALLDYILANLDEIVPRSYKYGVIFGIIKSVHSYERLDHIRDFVKNNFNEKLEDVQSQIETRKFELTNILNSF